MPIRWQQTTITIESNQARTSEATNHHGKHRRPARVATIYSILAFTPVAHCADATMLNRACSAKRAGRCLVRWHSLTHHFAITDTDTSRATFTQRSAGIHTTTHAQQHQQQQQQQQQHAHTQPGPQRKFRPKRRSRRRKGHEAGAGSEAEDNDNTNTHYDRNAGSSAGTSEKAAATFRRKVKEKETYSASSLSTCWTTPSVVPSQHPALQAVLQGVFLQQKQKQNSSTGRDSTVQEHAWDHQEESDGEEDERHIRHNSDTEKVEMSTFDADKVVSISTSKDTAFSKKVASNNEGVSNLIDNKEASEPTGANVEIISSSIDLDKASSQLARDNEATRDKKKALEHILANVEMVPSIGDEDKEEDASNNEEISSKEQDLEDVVANVEVVSSIANRRKRNWKPPVEARLQDKPYAIIQAGSSWAEKNDASSEVGKDVPDSNAPSKSSSDSSKRKAAWYLPSTASSANIENNTSSE